MLRKAKVFYHKTVDEKQVNVLMCAVRGHTISFYSLAAAAHNKGDLTASCLATEEREIKQPHKSRGRGYVCAKAVSLTMI